MKYLKTFESYDQPECNILRKKNNFLNYEILKII